MKKYIIVTLLLLSTIGVYSQEKVQFYSFGEFAYYPRLIDRKAPEGDYFSTQIGIGVSYKFLFIEAEQFVNMVKGPDIMFAPYKEQYYFRAGIQFSVIKIQYEHLCNHDVRVHSGYDGEGHDQISISFDTRELVK